MKTQHRLPLIAVIISLTVAASMAIPQQTQAKLPASTPKAIVKAIVKPPEATAVGNEPFWNITVSTTGILYRTPETQIQFPYVKPLQAIGRVTGSTLVYPLRKGNQQGTLVLQKLTSGFCNDTMSDNLYPYSATVILNNTVLSGCASTPLNKVRTSKS